MSQWLVRWGGALSVVTAVICADQLTKVFVPHNHWSIVEPARNPGVITGWSPVSLSVLILVSVVVLIGFVAVVGRWAVQLDISPAIPALVVGGLLAHTIDRIRFGAVRDFLATGWLIVDVADLAVLAGLGALLVAFAVRLTYLRKSSRTI
ncbi:MAG: hypothetical protein QOF59_792, partial [Actinomycetota bacterium]|nr:hypothetical protein [Actinomycetota bacterium]